METTNQTKTEEKRTAQLKGLKIVSQKEAHKVIDTGCSYCCYIVDLAVTQKMDVLIKDERHAVGLIFSHENEEVTA